MTRFHIVHVLAEDRPGCEAYLEVIETVQWGLQQLGHETTYGVNTISPNVTNIIFGANCNSSLVQAAPEDTICYNLEQVRGHPQFNSKHELSMWDYIAKKFRVWDYSVANIPSWNRLNPKYPVRHMPICYAPILKRIPNTERQDIDVLIYGGVSERRLAVFSALAKTKLSSVFAYRLYGAYRDSLIARSKIVLNIGSCEYGMIFEIVRVSFLMANSKAVISDFWTESYIEQDIPDGVIFSRPETLVQACEALLADDKRRIQMEHRGFECISRRDIRGFLSTTLA